MAITRTLTRNDHAPALILYRALVNDAAIDTTPEQFTTLISHPGAKIFRTEAADNLQAMVTLHILPNVTQGGPLYGFIENTVSHPDARSKGYGRLAMQAAVDATLQANAYKITLLSDQDTGAKPQ